MASPGGLPSGTVTFLFTDVEGSTRLWEDDPVGMRRSLERHDAIIREEIDRHGGHVFATGGDGFAASFARADEAVGAAVAAQRRLQAESWAGGVPIRVRMGVHTGEAAERGGDYFGPAVNRTARLTAVAHGGQIVASDTTAAIAEGETGVRFVDAGEHVLKDLAGPVRAWVVHHPGLEAGFPPLRSLARYRHNLPTALEPLIGRDVEVRDLVGLVGDHRLVTLVGPGGVGKTRLSIQVAVELVDRWPDGVGFVDLVPARPHVDSVAEAIGRAVGFDARQGESWSATVVASLSVREVLVVLDNCEHVLAPVADLAHRVLDAGAGVRVLATSRQRLGVREERLYPVGPLAAGPELFVARARALDPGFDAVASRAAIEELCDRLDGLPLAIELAAARVRTLQPEEMVARLDRRFRLLRGRDATADRRHQTLAATIDWSFDQLPSDAQDLFCQLGVFSGDFDLAAVVGLAQPALDEVDVVDLLEELEARSLVVSRRAAGTTRYRLLDSLAAYARERLEEAGRLEATRRAHARMRAARTATTAAAAQAAADSAPVAFGHLRADLVDIEAAFSWSSHHEPSTAEDLFVAVAPVVNGFGPSRARRLGERIVELWRSGRCADRPASQACAVLAASGGGATADATTRQLLGRPDLDDASRALCLAVAAWADLLFRNDTDHATALAEQALVVASSVPDLEPRWLSLLRQLVVLQLFQAGRVERAAELAQQHEPRDLAHRPAYAELQFLYAAGVALRPKDLTRSTHALERCARFLEELFDAQAVAARYQLALNRLARRDGEGAARDLAVVLPQLLDRGDPLMTALAVADLGTALYRAGELATAVTAHAVSVTELARRGATAYGVYVERRQRHLVRLRAQLGDDAFDAAWSEGQTLTIDEAVRYLCALVAERTFTASG